MKTLAFFVVALFSLVMTGRAAVIYPPATQAEVNAGSLTSKFVSPATLAGWTGGGGGSAAMSYVALPTSGIIGGSTLAYSTNLSADITLTASNLLSTNRYYVQWLSAGHKVTFANSAAWFFTDAGQGGYSESTTNAGFHELQLWRDAVSGRTNALYHGPEYAVVFGSGVTAETNKLLRTVTITADSWLPKFVNGPVPARIRWSLEEEFWPNAGNTDGQIGGEYWTRSLSGTAFGTNTGQYPGTLGGLSMVTISSGSRFSIGLNAFQNVVYATNGGLFFISSFRQSAIDENGNTNTLRIGCGNFISQEPTSGIYFRSTNNTWELVTARNGSRTIRSTGSNSVAHSEQIVAWYLDMTGTNVYGWIGSSFTNMACVATNTTHIPHDYGSYPFVYSQHGLTNNLPSGRTNIIDFFYLGSVKY